MLPPPVHDAHAPLTEVARLDDANDLAWLDTTLVVQYTRPVAPPIRLWDWQLARLPLDGAPLQPLALPDPPLPHCQGRTAFLAPARLPDGRLRYVARCARSEPLGDDQLYLMAYDPQSGAVQPLHPQPLAGPAGEAWLLVGDYSFSPDLTQALVTDGFHLVGQLYWLTPQGTQHLDVGADIVRDVAWSPDGETIAYTAAQAGWLQGPGRLRARYDLLVMDRAGQQRRVLVAGFQFRAGITWSPDGRWLVLTGEFDARAAVGGPGVWLVDAQTGERWRLAEGRFHSPSWEPHGARLAVVRSRPNPDTVVVLDLAPLLDQIAQARAR